MSWLHNFLSKFHHAETALSDEGKQILEHVESEFKTLETRVAAIEQHLIGGAQISVPPAPAAPAA